MVPPRTKNPGSPLVAPLSYFKKDDLALAGGKAASLGELLNKGFAIPPGFVISTAAYDLFLQTNEGQTQLHRALTSLDADSPKSVADTSRKIGDIFQQISIPRQLTDEILKAYRELDVGAVAVRSSATAEDLPGAAFAG